MAELINANPTILSAADLPSRHAAKPNHIFAQTSREYLDSIIPKAVPDPLAISYDSPSSYALDQNHEASVLDDSPEPIDEQEIYDLIANIADPEHPLTLGSLSVINLPDIHLAPLSPGSPLTVVTVLITPTITMCSLATVIGLGVRVRLEQALPPRFRVDVRLKEGTHSSVDSTNRQLADKERVAAALENNTLAGIIRKMLESCDTGLVT